MSANNLKNFKISLRYKTQFAFWRMLNLLIVGILLIGSGFAIYFVCNNINNALENTTLIINLKTNATFDSLDLKNYDTVNKKIKQKENLPALTTSTRNIFEYGPIVTTTTASTTSSSTTTSPQ